MPHLLYLLSLHRSPEHWGLLLFDCWYPLIYDFESQHSVLEQWSFQSFYYHRNSRPTYICICFPSNPYPVYALPTSFLSKGSGASLYVWNIYSRISRCQILPLWAYIWQKSDSCHYFRPLHERCSFLCCMSLLILRLSYLYSFFLEFCFWHGNWKLLTLLSDNSYQVDLS